MDKGATQIVRSGELEGKEVVPIAVNLDGTLRVRDLKTRQEHTLIADYLF
tara:strand:+ start:815 stop:964 length:150 start_codon:yes stop_codon:yes gene_type:complete